MVTHYQTYKAAGILSTLLVVLMVIPAPAAAQWDRDRSYWNYSSTTEVGTTPAEREMFRELRWSNEFRQKVANLPDAVDTTLPLPILFGVDVDDIFPNFGDPRDGGARLHEGEDILVVKGTPVVSPTPAVVIRTGTGTNQGNYVTTANPGGENFVYMHLDRIGEDVAEGDVLTEGSLIGYVGNTGNASGGPAHLHLEIHNSDGEPIDPFPRLTTEFTVEQKITFLETILEDSSDSKALAQLLVEHFRNVFLDGAQRNIMLPLPVTEALATVPATTPPASGDLPTDDLASGSNGTAVVRLQTFLIEREVGERAQRLARAGATGYFGPITESALIEYQEAKGITPAVGYYGPITRAAIAAGTNEQQPATTPSAGDESVFTRDLYYGVSGTDVRTLQQFLNTRGYTVATSGAGSSGSETNYFGPATQAALIRFQQAHNIEPAAGYLGPITRETIANL